MIQRIKEEAGFSLVEVIVSMVILTMIYTMMFRVLSGQKSIGATSEVQLKAIFLGKELIHKVLSKNYDENQNSPWTHTNLLGQEVDDVFYDDIDDFAGYTNSSIDDFPGFTEKVRVFYVQPGGSLDDSVYSTTDMKKIIVTVTHSGIDPVVFETVVSSQY